MRHAAAARPRRGARRETARRARRTARRARARRGRPRRARCALPDVDVLVNSASYRVNLDAMRACLRGRLPLRRPRRPVLDDRRAARALRASSRPPGCWPLLGMGSSPGKTNVMAARAVRELGADPGADRRDRGGPRPRSAGRRPGVPLLAAHAGGRADDGRRSRCATASRWSSSRSQRRRRRGARRSRSGRPRRSTRFTREVRTFPATASAARECSFRLSLAAGGARAASAS